MSSDASHSEVLLVETKTLGADSIEIWTVNRPDKLNAINSHVIRRLDEETTRLKKQLENNLMSCRALILQGAGEKAFVAGADIAEMKDFLPDQASQFSRQGQIAFGRLEQLPIPTLAALKGFTLGGGLELAMCCDILVASQNSEFGQPEAHLGLIPGFGATARFVDRLGSAKALEFLYTGQRMKAPEALAFGLIQRLAPANIDVLDFTLEVVSQILSKSGPIALATIKQIVRAASMAKWNSTLELESQKFGEVFGTEDKKEGVSAFLEKRKAVFTGR